jgi:hypothetical protein
VRVYVSVLCVPERVEIRSGNMYTYTGGVYNAKLRTNERAYGIWHIWYLGVEVRVLVCLSCREHQAPRTPEVI